MNNSDALDAMEWFPHRILSGEDHYALLILNQPINEEIELFVKRNWTSSPLHIAVDGGANQLKKLSDNVLEKCYIPEIICGDFDSATSEVLDFFKGKGTKVVHTPDQDETDFTKALRVTKEYVIENALQVSSILAIVRNGDRVDHMIGNLNTLFLARDIVSVPVFILGYNSLTWLLSPGHHKIHISQDMLDSHVGLIPLGKECEDVSTTGLQWNLDHSKMKFGGLISTCNKFDGSEIVTVTTDTTLIWTMEVKLTE
ncbi:hypothetical protein JTE90_024857 [Oedothorax gibbosus]|uniref:Thiamine pyrophosphokinase n=1 Tax=Oedothorax gibbosus TaxID=931172 RepID=A0AAV6V1S6_9ARAC|nr:hypothetical protein JTE90_024857 [Oedothorax gibbosus]